MGKNFKNKFVPMSGRDEICKCAEHSNYAEGQREEELLGIHTHTHTRGIGGAGEQMEQSATVAAAQHCALISQ